jgi:hypothetical protein
MWRTHFIAGTSDERRFKRFWRRLCVCLLAVLPATGYAQWGTDIKLSTNEVAASLNENMGQCLIANGATLHAVWSDNRSNGGAIYYKRSTDDGLTWGPDTRVSGTPAADSFPLLALSGSTVHLVFLRSNGAPQAASFYKRSPDGGDTWEPDVFLGSTKWWPGVAAAGPMVYVSLNTSVTSSNSEVYFRRSTNNGTTWEPQQQISNANGRSEDPAIAATGNRVHLVWNDNRDGTMEVYYRRSTNQGLTWDAETSLTHVPDNTYMPTIYLSGLHADVAYGNRKSGQFQVYHLHSGDGGSTWGADQQITETTNTGFYPAIARDGLNVHVAWTEMAGAPVKYRHSGNGGASWEPVVALGSGGSIPFVAAGGESMHVIYVSQRDGHGAIYYVRNPTGNPAPPILNPQRSVQPESVDLNWTSVTGASYSIEFSTNLLDGFSAILQSNVLATPPSNSITVPMTNDRSFYRLRF